MQALKESSLYDQENRGSSMNKIQYDYGTSLVGQSSLQNTLSFQQVHQNKKSTSKLVMANKEFINRRNSQEKMQITNNGSNN